MQRFRGGLVFKAHRLLYHSTLGSRVIKKKVSVGSQVATTRNLISEGGLCSVPEGSLRYTSVNFQVDRISWARLEQGQAVGVVGSVGRAHRLLYHSTLGLRVTKKRRRRKSRCVPIT